MKKRILKISIILVGLFLLLNNSNYNLAGTYINCGGARVPEPITIFSRTTVILLKIIVPLGLIIIGSVDFIKAVTANNEGDIKKKQSKFLKRLMAAGIMFFVVSIVQLVVSFSAESSNREELSKCLDCMINDNTSCGEIMAGPETDYPEQGETYVPDPDFQQPEYDEDGEDEE